MVIVYIQVSSGPGFLKKTSGQIIFKCVNPLIYHLCLSHDFRVNMQFFGANVLFFADYLLWDYF